MIYLTKMNKKEFILNIDLIEVIEETPDTIITLTNGHRMIVRESPEEIIKKIMEFKRKIFTHNIDLINKDFK